MEGEWLDDAVGSAFAQRETGEERERERCVVVVVVEMEREAVSVEGMDWDWFWAGNTYYRY